MDVKIKPFWQISTSSDDLDGFVKRYVDSVRYLSISLVYHGRVFIFIKGLKDLSRPSQSTQLTQTTGKCSDRIRFNKTKTHPKPRKLHTPTPISHQHPRDEIITPGTFPLRTHELCSLSNSYFRKGDRNRTVWLNKRLWTLLHQSDSRRIAQRPSAKKSANSQTLAANSCWRALGSFKPVSVNNVR